MAPAPSLHGRYPLPRYYEPVRLPAVAADTVMASRAASGSLPLQRRASQVPRPICPRALSPYTPESPTCAHTRCFHVDGRLRHIWQVGRSQLKFTRPIRVHLRYGSRVRFPRLRPPDRSDARPGRYLLNGQFAESSPFQVTRSARLVLAHQMTQLTSRRAPHGHGRPSPC
jgi:hypothetical protein